MSVSIYVHLELPAPIMTKPRFGQEVEVDTIRAAIALDGDESRVSYRGTFGWRLKKDGERFATRTSVGWEWEPPADIHKQIVELAKAEIILRVPALYEIEVGA